MAALTDEMRNEMARLTSGTPQPSPHRSARCTSAGLWVRPHASDALGVRPDQIAEATAHLRAHGVTADFNSEGQCIVTSEKQFHAVAKARGMKTGRDGYDQKNYEGRSIHSGRTAAQERRRLRGGF